MGLIGAGPIGVEMAAVLNRAGISYVHLESGQIGATLMRWPRYTRFFSSPEWISIAGVPIQNPGQEYVTAEEYLAYMRLVVEQLDLRVKTYEPVIGITGRQGDFVLRTRDIAERKHTYRVGNVVLATGDLAHPRRIGVEGEDLPHVTHEWKDPHQYFQKELLIVGGRNSAVEAAVRCWRAGARVSMSYRGAGLDENRLISRLFLDADLLIRNGQVRFYPNTVPAAIRPGSTILRDTNGTETSVDADFVYLATGFEMDETLYAALGVELRDDERKPHHDPATMETNVPGVYVIGTAIGGNQRRFRVFITTSHDHCLRAARAIAPSVTIKEAWVGNYPSRDYPLGSGDVE